MSFVGMKTIYMQNPIKYNTLYWTSLSCTNYGCADWTVG
jgi:hypothetical protein